MKPYNVEIFTQDFEMVGNTNVNEITYKEDYLSADDNTVTVLALSGIQKQDYIRISRGQEEYAGIITEIEYGTDKSKKLQSISYKPLMELLNTDILFDVNAQGQGTMEQFICGHITEMFINNADEKQNIRGLSVSAATKTTGWSLHITPSRTLQYREPYRFGHHPCHGKVRHPCKDKAGYPEPGRPCGRGEGVCGEHHH